MILVKELGAIALIYVFIHILMRSLHHSKTTANPRQLPPGPQGYPIVGALPLLLRKNPHATLAELAKTYGPITYLKVGTEGMVVASSPDTVRAFLKTHDSNFMDRPRNAGSTLLGYNSQDMVFGRYDAKWKLLRKLSNVHMMGSQALAESMDIRASEVGHMLVAMYQASERGEMVVVPHMLMYGIANMIGQIMLSQRIFATKGNEVNEFRDLVVEVMRSAGRFNIGDFIPSIAWMDLQGIEKQFKRMHLKFDYLISGMLDEHEASAHTRKDKHDFVDILMANRDSSNDDERLTTTNIKALILNSLLAGTDTTSSAIEWALVEMIKNPTILKRAQEEMDRVIGRNRRFLESDIPGLPYLRAICMETFRLHPSTPLNLPRVASEDCIIDGYYIPKNTRLSVNIWAIGRDPTVWEDPLYFNPDRFMSGEYAKMDPVGDDFRLVTFGAGRRYCAGSKMGVVLVEYLLGTLVHSFDWKLPKEVGEINMDEGFGLALQKAIPTAAFVTPRLGLHCYAT